MTIRAFGWTVLAVLCSPVLLAAQDPPGEGPQPTPPDQDLPPHITRLSWFGTCGLLAGR